MAICCTHERVGSYVSCPCACHAPRRVTIGRTGGWQAYGKWQAGTKTPGPGYWLARYAVNPPEGAPVDGDVIETPVQIVDKGIPVVWGFSNPTEHEYGGPAYRTWGIALDAWKARHPDAVFLPDRDRTQDAPDPEKACPEKHCILVANHEGEHMDDGGNRWNTGDPVPAPHGPPREVQEAAPPDPHALARHVLRMEGNARLTRAREVRAAKETILAEFGENGLKRLESTRDSAMHSPVSCDEWAKKLDEDAARLFAAADALKGV